MKCFLSSEVTSCSSFTKISKLISQVKYFWSYFNLKVGHFFGTPSTHACLLMSLITEQQIKLVLNSFTVFCLTNQVIPGHENPQKRRTMFGGYLFKHCCVKYQLFTRYVRRHPSKKINTKKLPEKLFRCLREP